MKTVAVGQFKAKCLGLLEEVRRKREPLLITKRGIPLAQVIPLNSAAGEDSDSLLGTILFEKDIVSPTGEKWNADR